MTASIIVSSRWVKISKLLNEFIGVQHLPRGLLRPRAIAINKPNHAAGLRGEDQAWDCCMRACAVDVLS